MWVEVQCTMVVTVFGFRFGLLCVGFGVDSCRFCYMPPLLLLL